MQSKFLIIKDFIYPVWLEAISKKKRFVRGFTLFGRNPSDESVLNYCCLGTMYLLNEVFGYFLKIYCTNLH